jgi:hypothetical protein
MVISKVALLHCIWVDILASVYHQRLDLKSPYTEEFEVDTIVKALGLSKMRDEVDAALDKL